MYYTKICSTINHHACVLPFLCSPVPALPPSLFISFLPSKGWEENIPFFPEQSWFFMSWAYVAESRLTFTMRSVPVWMINFAAAAAKSLQSCLTLCDPIDGGPPGSPIPGILQARTLEWVAISFSNAWKWKVKVKLLSHVRLLATWTAAHQAPPSMGFSRQEYWSGLPLPSPINFMTSQSIQQAFTEHLRVC